MLYSATSVSRTINLAVPGKALVTLPKHRSRVLCVRNKSANHNYINISLRQGIVFGLWSTVLDAFSYSVYKQIKYIMWFLVA